MKKTVRNLAALFVMAVAILLSGTMTAYAYVDETEEAAAESVISEETPEKTEITREKQMLWKRIIERRR